MDQTISSITEQLGSPSLLNQIKAPGEVDPAVASTFAGMLQTSTVNSTSNDAINTSVQVDSQGKAITTQTAVSTLPPLTNQQQDTLPSPLLGVLNNFSTSYQEKVNSVQQNLAQINSETGDFSAANILKTQYSMLELGLVAGEASKVAGSLVNGINQLVKMQ